MAMFLRLQSPATLSMFLRPVTISMFLRLQPSVMAMSTACSPPKLRPSQLKLHPYFSATLRPQFPFRNRQQIQSTPNFSVMAMASLRETAVFPPELRPSQLKLHPLFRAILRPQFPFKNSQQSRLTPHLSVMAMSSLPETACSPPKLRPSQLKLHPLFSATLRPQFPFRNCQEIQFARHFSSDSSSHSSSSSSSSQECEEEHSTVLLFVVILMALGNVYIMYLACILADHIKKGGFQDSVIKLQVGSSGMERSFQRELDQIAKEADTSTPAGLRYVLTETILALLLHPDSCISAYSSVDTNIFEGGKERFNQLSIEERSKFDETLFNVHNIKRHSSISRRSSIFNNEDTVITILVAAKGVHKLPVINSSYDLKIALMKLGSIPSNKIKAVEVLWNPHNESDTLSERQLLDCYPLLRPL